MSATIEAYRTRASVANAMLYAISERGRRFFAHAGRVSRFEVDDRGRVWYVDKYHGRRLYCHGRAPLANWRFSEGGTLRSLCLDLVKYIRTGERIRGHLGPWPRELFADGNPWAYPDHEMAELRELAHLIGLR